MVRAPDDSRSSRSFNMGATIADRVAASSCLASSSGWMCRRLPIEVIKLVHADIGLKVEWQIEVHQRLSQLLHERRQALPLDRVVHLDGRLQFLASGHELRNPV
jgi:hypothetical protein